MCLTLVVTNQTQEPVLRRGRALIDGLPEDVKPKKRASRRPPSAQNLLDKGLEHEKAGNIEAAGADLTRAMIEFDNNGNDKMSDEVENKIGAHIKKTKRAMLAAEKERQKRAASAEREVKAGRAPSQPRDD